MSAAPLPRPGPQRVQADPSERPAHAGDADFDFDAPESPCFVPAATVDAVCRAIKSTRFGSFGDRLVFRFIVSEPQRHAGARLEMYCRYSKKWASPPISSKLYKSACIAYGGLLPRRVRIKKELWLGRLFRCQTRAIGNGPATYTIIDQILEKLT